MEKGITNRSFTRLQYSFLVLRCMCVINDTVGKQLVILCLCICLLQFI